jgi:hypothetical protein
MRLRNKFSLCLMPMLVIGCAPSTEENEVQSDNARASRVTPATAGSPATPAPDASASPANSQGSAAPGQGSAAPIPAVGGDSSPGAAPAPRPASSSSLFVGETRSLVPVINLLSSGRLEIVDNCLTVLVRGARTTAVFPPGVRLERRNGAPVAVLFQGERLPIGEDTRIPGGGLRASETPLVKPLPANCPKSLFGVGG